MLQGVANYSAVCRDNARNHKTIEASRVGGESVGEEEEPGRRVERCGGGERRAENG